MKINSFITPLLKWWWLIILSIAIATTTSFFIVRSLPPVYLAHTTLMVGRAISDPNPTGNEFGTAIQLAIYYTNIALREPIRQATEQILGLEELPKYTAESVTYSPFIEISVTDTDPNRAMVVANELARQLILQSPTAPQKVDLERQEFLNEQLAQTQQSILETQDEIQQKQRELPLLTSATQIEDIQAEIAALETRLFLLQTNYAELINTTQSGAINTLSIIEIATLPVLPIGPKKVLIVGLAGVAAMVLSIGVTYLLEFLDRTIKKVEDVEQVLQVPVLGSIQRIGNKVDSMAYLSEEPRSPFAESFRGLRANLGFISIKNPIHTVLITSAYEDEGKTTIAVNLATALAQADKEVLLADADLHRPTIHNVLKIPVQPGLSDAFQEKSDVLDFIRTSTNNENLRLLTSGKKPPNPADLLNSNKMDEILETLRTQTDIMIVDGPPLFIPDAAILASKVDGVILVIRPGRLRFEHAEKINAQIQRAGGKIVGVVLNQVRGTDPMLYNGYNYYTYGDSEKKENNNQAIKRFSLPYFIFRKRAPSNKDTQAEGKDNGQQKKRFSLSGFIFRKREASNKDTQAEGKDNGQQKKRFSLPGFILRKRESSKVGTQAEEALQDEEKIKADDDSKAEEDAQVEEAQKTKEWKLNAAKKGEEKTEKENTKSEEDNKN